MLNVKPYRQRPSYCGPASLKMVLDYYGFIYHERDLAKRARTSFKHGTRAENLVRVARNLGLRATIYDTCTLSDIQYYLKKAIPVIVNWFSTDDGHYSVVVGMDKKYIYLQDPELGALRKMDLAVFKRVWFNFRGSYLKDKKSIVLRRIIVIEKK